MMLMQLCTKISVSKFSTAGWPSKKAAAWALKAMLIEKLCPQALSMIGKLANTTTHTDIRKVFHIWSKLPLDIEGISALQLDKRWMLGHWIYYLCTNPHIRLQQLDPDAEGPLSSRHQEVAKLCHNTRPSAISWSSLASLQSLTSTLLKLKL